MTDKTHMQMLVQVARRNINNEELFHIADIVHSEIISFEHPDWIYNSDTDYKMAIKTRKEILECLTDNKNN